MPNPAPTFKFNVIVPRFTAGGFSSAGFSKVSGIEKSIEEITYREGSDPNSPRKLPGLETYPNVTLERGLTKDPMFTTWIETTSNDAEPRTSVVIQVLDRSGNATAEFELRQAWAKMHKLEDLDANANEVLIESLEIAHEGVRRRS